MEMLGRYEPTTQLSNQNAGSCRWCFAVRNRKEYFIKEYLEPKHPQNDTESSPEKIARKLEKCRVFEQEKIRTFRAINANSDGNAVRVEDFFRVGAKYYAVMPRIYGMELTEPQVAELSMQERRKLCAVIAHALGSVHAAGYVHSDIKHDNVLLMRLGGGNITAKLIDYDAGFFEDHPPQNPEQIAGDQVYYAPEVCDAILGGPIRLSRKADIFSLGVLFHQYFTGRLPDFDHEQFGCAGEAVQQGGRIEVAQELPQDLCQLLRDMLAANPDARPAAMDICARLRREERTVPQSAKPQPKSAPAPDDTFRGDAPGQHKWASLGDL